MIILTLENKAYHLNNLPDVVEDDLRYAIFDNSDKGSPDYFFQPLLFLESFTGPAAVLRVGNNDIMIPLDWCTIIGDSNGMDLEVIPLISLNDRGFKAFCFNPLTSTKPEFHDIDIVNIYQDIKWYFPKLKTGQMLCMPLTLGENPICAYFAREVTKQGEVIPYAEAW